ncbi:MAG TPA: DUF4292 domain-containing protein [Bacteroidales bacterium]|nr:DUF4292 domain-containing protein [Bacteroidales bacterium]|tara:strand:+ start:405 stop:1250 length:846 start_codon:yes stop_codon:yes gene_type:complete
MNKYISKILFLFLVVSLTYIGTSCKSKKHVLKESIKEYGFSYLYARLLENQIQFNYLNANFSLVYRQEKNKTNLRGQLRMDSDSLIWMSFTPLLGIEAARVMITNDSIKFLNRLNKTYFTGKFELVDSLLNTTIDFSLLQSLLVGNDLAQYDVNKFRSSVDNGMYRMTIRERRKIKRYIKKGEIETKVLVQQIWLDPETFRITRIDIKEQGEDENKKLQVYYSDYIYVNDQLFPSKIRIEIKSQKSIFIDINFNKVDLNKPLNFPFKIPRKYENLLLMPND